MKKLYIQFQDGSHFWGHFDLYRSGLYERGKEINDQSNYSVSDVRVLLYYWDQISFIKHIDSKFLYNKSSVVKMRDLTESEYIILNRSNKLDRLEV